MPSTSVCPQRAMLEENYTRAFATFTALDDARAENHIPRLEAHLAKEWYQAQCEMLHQQSALQKYLEQAAEVTEWLRMRAVFDKDGQEKVSAVANDGNSGRGTKGAEGGSPETGVEYFERRIKELKRELTDSQNQNRTILEVFEMQLIEEGADVEYLAVQREALGLSAANGKEIVVQQGHIRRRDEWAAEIQLEEEQRVAFEEEQDNRMIYGQVCHSWI